MAENIPEILDKEKPMTFGQALNEAVARQNEEVRKEGYNCYEIGRLTLEGSEQYTPIRIKIPKRDKITAALAECLKAAESYQVEPDSWAKVVLDPLPEDAKNGTLIVLNSVSVEITDEQAEVPTPVDANLEQKRIGYIDWYRSITAFSSDIVTTSQEEREEFRSNLSQLVLSPDAISRMKMEIAVPGTKSKIVYRYKPYQRK